MKILFLAHYYYPHFGGVEKHMQLLCKQLQKRGHQISIISTKHDKSLNDREMVEGVDVLRITYPEKKLLGLLYIWYWFINNKKIVAQHDIVHCHDVFIWYLPLRFLYPKKLVFTTFHGYESYPIKKRAYLIRKLSEKLSKGNICIGDFMRKWYKTNPSIVSYGAVDSEIFNPDSKIKYDAIFAGRLHEQTGFKQYLETTKILNKIRNFTLLVLGDGEHRKGKQKGVIYKGWQKEVAPYLTQSKYAFVSRYLAILEALAAKRLVFALFDDPVKEDYLKMSPFAKWIVIEKDPKILAERVLFYEKHNIQSEQLVNWGYIWVKKQTWEKMADNYLKLWKRN